MNAHRIDIFHVADGDAVIGRIAHYFVFDLFPSQQAFFHQHLMAHARCQPVFHSGLQLCHGVDDAAAGPTQRVGGPYYQRQSDGEGELSGLADSINRHALRYRLTYLLNKLLE